MGTLWGGQACPLATRLSCLPLRRMSRDQRVRDNWALIYAAQAAAQRGVPVAVAFNLVGDRTVCLYVT